MRTTIPLGFILLILMRNFIVGANGRISVKSYCLYKGLTDSVSRSFCSFSESGFCCTIPCILSELNIHWFFVNGLRILEVWRYFYESPTVSLFFCLSPVYSCFLDSTSLFLTNRMCFSFLMQ